MADQKFPKAERPDTTVVVTSCGRHDLLDRALGSFVEFNSDPGAIARIVVVEDGEADPSEVCRRHGAELIRTGARAGQMAAIDTAYATVATPYIFHHEDDRELYRPGFLEKSRAILAADPSTVVVWLNPWDDKFGHPLSFEAPDGSFGVLATNYAGHWHGFTLQSGLRRLADYKRLGSFAGQAVVTKAVHVRPTYGLQFEIEANQFYHRLGYRAVILDREGYCRHIGADRHVSHPKDKEFDFARAAVMSAPCPCGSGRRYVECHGRGVV